MEGKTFPVSFGGREFTEDEAKLVREEFDIVEFSEGDPKLAKHRLLTTLANQRDAVNSLIEKCEAVEPKDLYDLGAMVDF